MSYCLVSEIGGSATIRHVKIARTVIDDALGEHTFYSPSASWEVIRGLHGFASEASWLTEVGFQCRSISEIAIYDRDRLLETVDSVTSEGRYARFSTVRGLFMAQLYRLKITGVRGTAALSDLNAGDDLLAGQSVLRGGEVTLIEEDGSAITDDQLISPPDLLRSVGITVGRRAISLELDEGAVFDDSSYQRENRLLDGWLVQAQKFMRR